MGALVLVLATARLDLNELNRAGLDRYAGAGMSGMGGGGSDTGEAGSLMMGQQPSLHCQQAEDGEGNRR